MAWVWTASTSKKALEDFSGVHRRFEILGKFEGVTVADDFAHHPTELSAVLSAAVRMGYHEVWACSSRTLIPALQCCWMILQRRFPSPSML